MRVFSPRIHAVLDYLVVAFLLVAPRVLNFPSDAMALAAQVAGVHFFLACLTSYPGGALPLVPFSVHGGMEILLGLLLSILPWLIGPETPMSVRVFFTAAGIGFLFLWRLTDYEAAVLPTESRTTR
jgi:hypothetical protein